MPLPPHKTRIVATIGPASGSAETLERIIRAGMDVARLNFSQGDFQSHAGTIRDIRLPVWVVGVSPREDTCQALQLSSGVTPAHFAGAPAPTTNHKG